MEAGLILCSAFAITVLLDLLLIPQMGMKGAAVSIAVTAFIYGSVKWFWLWKKLDLQPYNFAFVKNALLIAGIWLAVAWLPDTGNPVVNIVYKSGITFFAFACGLIGLNIIPEWRTFFPEQIRKKLP